MIDQQNSIVTNTLNKEQPILKAERLTKRYEGKSVVDGIDFQVHGGECFGILGPNGAGKTTTFRMIMGLTPIDAGSLTLFGHAVHPDHPIIPKKLGVVSQEDNLDIDLTVCENLLVFGRYFGISDQETKKRLGELLKFAQLEDRARSPVRALSGGMRRRLAIARSLIASPEAILLDEPTTGLDPQARHLIWQRLRALKRDGITLFLTTHYMEEAAQLCDRLMVLNKGQILEMGSPKELINKHVEPEVIQIQGCLEENDPLLSVDGCRWEKVGESCFVYTKDALPLVDQLQKRNDIPYLHRPANLEDLFLKLTGRDLRD
ncbi:ATP-binding cassette domain-containing protein [Magnetococcales bacterium HHB-1]